MAASKMAILTRAFALTGVFASAVASKALLSEETRTETNSPQEIGSITSDGLLIYSMNYCTIVQTTDCDISLSTGPPVPETSSPDHPGDDGTSTALYPAPTGGEPGEPGPPGNPTGGEPGKPTGGEGTYPPGGGEPTSSASDSPSESVTGSLTVSETTDAPTRTDNNDGGSGTPTDSSATGTSTAGGTVVNAFQAGVLGAAGMAVMYLV